MGYPADAIVADEPTVTITAAQARRIRIAFAKANAVLVRLDHVRSHPLSGAAREARSEIGAAVAHLDRALPPVGVDVFTGPTSRAAHEARPNGEAAPNGARHDTGLPRVGKQGAREVKHGHR
jgi:hypothetical protein